MNRRTLIIGPQGIGKTNYASALAHHFGASAVIDDYVDGAEFPEGTLALSISPDYAEFAPVGTAVYFVKTKADILDLINKTSSPNLSMNEQPICSDCRFYSMRRRWLKDEKPNSICLHPTYVEFDCVDGERVIWDLCVNRREPGSACGPEGYLFSERVSCGNVTDQPQAA